MPDDPKHQPHPSKVTNVTHGGITLGKGASITVGQGDVVAGDKIVNVVNQIVQGLGDLPTHYDGYVRNFLDYYLGTPDRPAPFGGRSADLAALDAWLADPNAPPYLLLAAPAGRGKSALLAHWVARLTDREATPHTVFFPVSIRFSSNRESVVFAALYARIAHLHGDMATRAADAHEYRSVFMDYVRRPPPDGGKLLIVLDGLDEAAGWEAGADLVPTQPPPHLRVVVAARALAGDLDWQTRLGWESPGKAKTLSLAGLDRDGVRDVLAQMGNPLDQLATKFDVVEKLHELSEGDPLLVRLYIEALLPRGSEAATFKPEDLLTLKPGLKPYFDLWFKQQESLWASAAERIDHDAVDDLLNLCATALGPERLKNSRTIERTMEAINRFVIGDGTEKSGYVFSHPRLREYFAERLTAKERKEWEARFLRYGKETLAALEAKTLKPGEAPAYAVKYYGAHLARANAPAADFYALMCEGWLRAWEWADGTPDGFLNDAHRAWVQAEVEGPAALGQIVRAALCVSSMVSVSANIPNDLLIACIKARVINPRLGLTMARAKPGLLERVECLARMSEFLPVKERRVVLTEALNAARAAHSENSRATALSAVAKHLPPEATDLLAEALSTARAIGWERDRADTLIAVAKHLPPEATDLLAEALSTARAIRDEFCRAEALSAVAGCLPFEEQRQVLSEALSAARAIWIKSRRALALSAIAECLPPEEKRQVLGEALNAARKDYNVVEVLLVIAERFPQEERKAVLTEALSAIRVVTDEYNEMDDRGLLAIASSFGYSKNLVSDLRAIAKRLLPEAPSLLAEVLSIARAIDNKLINASALTAISEELSPDEQRHVLAEALNATRTVGDELNRVSALSAVAKQLPSHEQRQVLIEALSIARAIGSKYDRALTLSIVAERLPPDEQQPVLAEALTAARTIRYEKSRASALYILAQQLSPNEQRQVLAEAMSTDASISYTHTSAPHVAEQLLPNSTESQLRELRLAQSLDTHRIKMLYRLAPHWSTICQAHQLSEFGELSATVRAFAKAKRDDLLGAIEALLPVIAQLGGEGAVRETAQAIADSAKWWP